MGRGAPELGSLWTCACVGIVRPPELLVQLRAGGAGFAGLPRVAEELLACPRLLRAGMLGGVFRLRIAAPGQPHSYSSVEPGADVPELYAGRDVLACVARHDKMLRGESMDISKCRLLFGSFSSGLDKRMTI